MITEDQLEQLAIQWFQDTGWNYVHGAVIAPEGGAAEREDRGNIEHRTLNIERRSEEKRSLAEAVQHMAELFQTTKQNIGQHLKSIFAEGELVQDSVVKESFTTAADGKNYATRFYNLDAIISVGYRVKSAVATRFRIWATRLLREYIVKGFLLDDERLKNPDQPFDYFEELMRRIQDIRTSERRFYQKITDIYAMEWEAAMI